MARAKSSTPNSHWLFLQIVATVSRSRGQRLTVSAVAKELGLSPSVIGHCIALHQAARARSRSHDLAAAEGDLSHPGAG